MAAVCRPDGAGSTRIAATSRSTRWLGTRRQRDASPGNRRMSVMSGCKSVEICSPREGIQCVPRCLRQVIIIDKFPPYPNPDDNAYSIAERRPRITPAQLRRVSLSPQNRSERAPESSQPRRRPLQPRTGLVSPPSAERCRAVAVLASAESIAAFLAEPGKVAKVRLMSLATLASYLFQYACNRVIDVFERSRLIRASYDGIRQVSA